MYQKKAASKRHGMNFSVFSGAENVLIPRNFLVIASMELKNPFVATSFLLTGHIRHLHFDYFPQDIFTSATTSP
jgi:hypothetical protein